MLRALFIMLLACLSNTCIAQIIPADNDTLNYRLAGFSVPGKPKTASCIFEIAIGKYNEDNDFRDHIILRVPSVSNRIVATLPYFGKEYTWRVKYVTKKGDSSMHTPYYHFSTAYSVYTDTSRYRLKVIDSATSHKDMLMFIDHNLVMYDMKGEPLWFLPDMPGLIQRGRGVRDLKPTGTGTFTVLSDFGIFEFDYNGKILWKGPNDGKVSGDTTERYHHEFTKLSNGNYMVASYEIIQRLIPVKEDSLAIRSDNAAAEQNMQSILSGNLIEYDKDGKVVWQWHSAKYFSDAEFFHRLTPDGQFVSSTHLNAFYFDEKKKQVYISFRNLNQVIKIAYPSGDILARYGEIPDGNAGKDVLFKSQHHCSVNDKGELYLFNNNTDRQSQVVSYVSVFRQPKEPKEQLKKTWEFSCDIDSNAMPFTTTGGSVYQLADGSFFAGMGDAARVFIVTPDKKIGFNAVAEYKDEYNKWIPYHQYRSGFIEDPANIFSYLFNKADN